MALYIIIFLVIVFLYVMTLYNPQSARVLMVIMAFLAIFVGISDMLGGYDRYIYAECFDQLANRMRGGRNIFASALFRLYGTEFGYCFLNVGVALFSANRYIFILVATLIVYTCLYFSFKRHTNNYAFAIILFLGLWFFFSFTYLRQVLGVSIAWLALIYVSKRDLKRFLIVVFIAATFHNSAIILLPLYFIPLRPFDKAKILIVMGVIFLLGLTDGPATLFEAYGGVVEDTRVQQNLADSSGFREAYLVEAVFFLFLILTNYDLITETEEQTVMTNTALVFCGILLFFVKSENGGRLAWYYMMGVISTLTYITTCQQRVTYKAMALIVVSFLLYMRILIGWGVFLFPYKTFFTDGVRKGDKIYNQFEYDHHYAKDKFYR